MIGMIGLLLTAQVATSTPSGLTLGEQRALTLEAIELEHERNDARINLRQCLETSAALRRRVVPPAHAEQPSGLSLLPIAVIIILVGAAGIAGGYAAGVGGHNDRP